MRRFKHRLLKEIWNNETQVSARNNSHINYESNESLSWLRDREVVAFSLTKIAALRESKDDIMDIAYFVWRIALYQLEISF